MEPKSLSASAAQMFETCEARYRWSYIERTPDIPGKAGSLGSACHEALELWIKTGQHLQPWPDVMAREKAMKVIWDMTYYDYFSEPEFYEEGWGMLRGWLQKQDWSSREVLSTEEKLSFEIPTSKGPLTVNYIIDRLDRLENGDIDVVDYKSVRQPVSHERLKYLIQPRLYAVAVRITYPDAPRIWVTYDLLRFTPVSAAFDRDDCIETWKYLRRLAERIYASDGTKETLNPECRFCIRKHNCETLTKHIDNGGVLGAGTLEEVSDRLALLSYQKGGIDQAITELQELGLTYAENDGVHEWETETVVAKITAKGRRDVDSEMAAKVVGPDIMARYGKLGVGTVEVILKEEELTDSQRSQLKQLMQKKWGAPRIDVKPKSPFDEE